MTRTVCLFSLALVPASLAGCGSTPATNDGGDVVDAASTPDAAGGDGGTMDAGAVDADVRVDAGTTSDSGALPDATGLCGAVEGMYELIWTGAAANPAACMPPLPRTVTVNPSGLPPSSPGSSGDPMCPPGCESPSNCLLEPLNASCESHVFVHTPCGGITSTQMLDMVLSFASGSFTATAVVDDASGHCEYTGVATRL